MAAFVLGLVWLNYTPRKSYSPLCFITKALISGVAPDPLEGPPVLVATKALVLKADVDVFMGAHEGDPGWGMLS
jgi:hypothetical protein